MASPEHWDYRRAFWTALHDWSHRGRLGNFRKLPAPRKPARLFGQNAALGLLEGMQPGHAVLLICIPGLIVAEWSHNNPCSIWDGEGEIGPRLYRAILFARRIEEAARGDDEPANLAAKACFGTTGPSDINGKAGSPAI